MNLSVRDNILLPSLTRDNHLLWVNRKAGDAVVTALMDLLDIRPRRPELRVGSLSGWGSGDGAMRRAITGLMLNWSTD